MKASAYEYINGVVPQNKNEIAITPTVSKLTGAKLGDTVTIDFGTGTLDCVVVAYFQSMNQLGEVIRLHEDAPTDFTYIANVMSYQIDFEDHPSAKEIEVRKEKRLYGSGIDDGIGTVSASWNYTDRRASCMYSDGAVISCGREKPDRGA